MKSNRTTGGLQPHRKETLREHYYRYMVSPTVSRSTVQHVRQALNRFDEFGEGELFIYQVTESLLDKFTDWLVDRGCSARSASDQKGRIRSIAAHAMPARFPRRASPTIRENGIPSSGDVPLLRRPFPEGTLRWFLREVYMVHRFQSSAMYLENLDRTLAMFDKWAGRIVRVDELTDELVLGFMRYRLACEVATATVNNARRQIISLWRMAWRKRYIQEQPRDVEPIRENRKPPKGWSIAEVQRLLLAASRVEGKFKNGTKAADWWCAIIRFGYDTGLRRGDCLAVLHEQLDSNGLLTVCQNKTGNPITVAVHPSTLEAIAKLPKLECGRIFPFPYVLDQFGRRFNAIAKAAELSGTFKYLRRTSGSYVDSVAPGMGGRHLGHRSPQVFARHYEDTSITRCNPAMPPELDAE